MLLVGTSSAVFNLARLAYLTEAIPLRLRARALSTLGGTLRFGLFVGPFIGAALVSRWSIGAAYAFAAGMALVAAAVTALLPDVTRDRRAAVTRAGQRHRSVLAVLAAHRRVLLTLGTGVLMISAARATRQSIIPLWAEAQGLDAATISVIFGLSAAVDMLLFYPGGAIMDRFGRVFVAVPAMIVLGAGFALLPLTARCGEHRCRRRADGLGQRHLRRDRDDPRRRCRAAGRPRSVPQRVAAGQRCRPRRRAVGDHRGERGRPARGGRGRHGSDHLGRGRLADPLGSAYAADHAPSP